MPRIRSIKPELFLSPQVMNLSRDARLLFIGLITQADDHGRGSADPRKLKAAIFAGDDDVTAAKVLEFEEEIESQGLAIFYEGGPHGRLYALPTWRNHQYVQKAKQSAYPGPPRTGNGRVPESSDTDTVGSDLMDRKDRKDPDARARVSGSHPVDKSAGRARAPDGSHKGIAEGSEEVKTRRAQAAALVTKLAAVKRP